MEFIGLDSNFVRVKPLKCTNIQWNRKYHEAGDFQIQLRTSDWDTSIAYVYTTARPETGMVQKIEADHEQKGEFVLVSGLFLEGMLNWKITHPKHSSTGNLSAACKALVAAHMPDTGVTVLEEADIGDATPFDSEHEKLGDATYAALKKQGMSQRILLDYTTGAMRYGVWKGLDRTQNQTENTYASFAQNFGNVDEMTLTTDDSDMKNYAIVQYDNDGEEAYLEIDLREGGEPKRIQFIQSSISKDEMTAQEYLDAIDSDARTQMQDYAAIVNLDVGVIQRNLRYLTDYDLGDLCNVKDDRLQLSFETRITEVDEVWKGNEHTVNVQFGDKLPTTYRKGY
jgi:hypothetical protein